MPLLLELLQGGLDALADYVLAHTLTCLLPAMFVAGALYALFPKDTLLRHLGANSPKRISYPLSQAAGFLLAVCSCTVLPLFAGIWRSGAGLGPAMAFLYIAPASNLLAIVYTTQLIGFDLAVARIALSATFACVVGITVSAMFGARPASGNPTTAVPSSSAQSLPAIQAQATSGWRWAFFATLVAILVVGASSLINLPTKLGGLALLLGFLLLTIRRSLSRDDIMDWLRETWFFVKRIFPLLLVGVFVAGMIKVALPQDLLVSYLGQSTLWANLGAVLFGVFMYFPTLVEVPMARLFLDLGMGRGPLLAYLLADPVLSLPSLLVIQGLIGVRRTLWYAVVVTVCCTAAGLIYGFVYSLGGGVP